MVLKDIKDASSLPRSSGGFSKSSPPPPEMDVVDPYNRKNSSDSNLDTEKVQNKPGGWRAITFILGNETLERLGTIGLLSNFMVYLTRVFHLEQVDASNVINIWSGFTNLTPLVGAFISDAYVGRFKTIAFASFATLIGLVTLTLTASLPQLHPATCNSKDPVSCGGPNKLQFGVLLLGLGFLSIGSGGIRPCSIPFGVDQFDQRTEEGLKGVASFFNWYYMTFTIVLLITQTVVVYIQDQVSWIIGFSVPTGLMACAVVMFFAGMKLYVYVKPEGSIFSGIAQVVVAARKKRKMKLPAEDDGTVNYYDPPVKDSVLSKLHHSNQFRFLDKAAVIVEGDLTSEGVPANNWRLCSIQEVEEVKCLIRIVPVWSAGIISLAAMSQQGTFTVSQALKMDRQSRTKKKQRRDNQNLQTTPFHSDDAFFFSNFLRSPIPLLFSASLPRISAVSLCSDLASSRLRILLLHLRGGFAEIASDPAAIDDDERFALRYPGGSSRRDEPRYQIGIPETG